MKLSTAVAILIVSDHASSLSIHPHQRRYNDVVINTALSSTAFDQRAPPASIGYNEDGLENVDYISSALLEPPIQDQQSAENVYHENQEENGWSAHNYEQHNQADVERRQMNQNPMHQQVDRHQHQPQFSQQSQNFNSYNVRTGAERRSSWESYATPGIPGRTTSSNFGGVIGSPNGIGDWEYTSSYSPATSVNSFDSSPRGRTASSSPRRAATYTPKKAVSYNMGNVVGMGGHRPMTRESSYHVGGAVMTGAQRRAGFQNIHSFEPYVPSSATHHLPDASIGSDDGYSDGFEPVHDIASDNYASSGGRDVVGESFNGLQPLSSETESTLPTQSFDTNNAQSSSLTENEAGSIVNGFKQVPGLEGQNKKSFNSFKPLMPPTEVQNDSQQVSTMSSQGAKFAPLVSASAAPNAKQANTNTAPLKSSVAPFSPLNGAPGGLDSATKKGPGSLGVKGKEPVGGVMKSGIGSAPVNGLFGKSVSAPSFKGSEGSSMPISSKNTSGAFSLKSSGPSSKGVFGGDMKGVGVGSFGKSSFKSSETSTPFNGMGHALSSGMMKEPSIRLKGNEPGTGAAGISPDLGPSGKSSSNLLKGAGGSALPANGMKKNAGGLEVKSLSNGVFGESMKKSVLGPAPGASAFVKFNNAAPIKGTDASSPSINGSGNSVGGGVTKNFGFGLKGGFKSSPSLGGGIFGISGTAETVGPSNSAFGMSSSSLFKSTGDNGGVASRPSPANSDGASATTNKFKPFVPSLNAPTDEQPKTESSEPKSFEDFVHGQGNAESTKSEHPLTSSGSQSVLQNNSLSSGLRASNGFKSITPLSDNQVTGQNNLNGFKPSTPQQDNINVGGANASPNKFKPFVPSFNAKTKLKEDETPAKQDLASFLKNPGNAKRDAKQVAASLSALSSPPIFYNDFESAEVVETPSNVQELYVQEAPENQHLNFGISNGAFQEMPSVSEVPMNTPARQSLPPYLSLHPIAGKGLGVITNKSFKIGEFVGNYEGEIMSEEVKDRRYLKSLESRLTDEDRAWIESRLSRGQTITGTYLYGVDLDGGDIYKHFGRKNGQEEAEEATPDRIFVDAEDEYESLWTRFINHASPPLDNLKPMSVPESYDGKPRVWFMAKRDIEPGEELCFDYGDDYWLEGDEVF